MPIGIRRFQRVTAPPAPVDVSLTASAPRTIVPGETATWQVRLTNDTFAAATGVVANIASPAVSFRTPRFDVGSLAPGQSRLLRFTGTVAAGTAAPFTVRATVATSSRDPDTSNNARTLTSTVPLTFAGFVAPTAAPPALNRGAAGGDLPVRFRIVDDAGGQVSNTAAVKSFSYKPATCGAFSGDPRGAIPATGTLAFVSGSFSYTWRTPSTPGCYELFATLSDGDAASAYFSLR